MKRTLIITATPRADDPSNHLVEIGASGFTTDEAIDVLEFTLAQMRAGANPRHVSSPQDVWDAMGVRE